MTMDSFLNMTGMSAPQGAAFLLMLAAALAVGGMTASHRAARRLHRRIAGALSSAAPPGVTKPAAAATSLRRAAPAGFFAPLAAHIHDWLPRLAVLRDRLARAGLRLAVTDFAAICLLSGIAVAAWMRWQLNSPLWLAACLGLVTATGIPHLFLRFRTATQARKFVTLLPDAIDLVVRGVRSGLPVTEALHSIGQEMAEPVGGTFREVIGGIRLGMTLDQALWTVARRLQLPEFKFFVISLSIQQETGGNLAEILDNLSQMIRRREQVKLKIRAMSSEARASALIIGSLPFVMGLVIYFVDPEYIMRLFVDPRGWMLLGAGAASLLFGLGVMVRMVRFEI